ncbi:MAG TPA: DUF4292 domain-containing protein [Pedobacter sp.]|nr:DUF4292 domain-containing protein [Pedobacter sp.]
MSRNTLNSVLLLTVTAVFMACGTKKAIVAIPKKGVESVPADTKKVVQMKLLKDKDLPFNTLSLRAKAELDINGNSNNVTMYIRIQKNEKIWVNITAFAGIEVARALITPDSIKVKNTMQGVYLKKPFSYAYRYTNKQVDFKLLQSVFAGNTISAFMNDAAELDQENGVWVLNGQQEDLAYRILFNTLLKVSEDNLNDVRTGQALKVEYGQYQKVNDSLFPSTLKINSIAGKQKININLEFSKIESNVPLEFPFTVPKKYEVIN